jgi:hypothetical protein
MKKFMFTQNVLLTGVQLCLPYYITNEIKEVNRISSYNIWVNRLFRYYVVCQSPNQCTL